MTDAAGHVYVVLFSRLTDTQTGNFKSKITRTSNVSDKINKLNSKLSRKLANISSAQQQQQQKKKKKTPAAKTTARGRRSKLSPNTGATIAVQREQQQQQQDGDAGDTKQREVESKLWRLEVVLRPPRRLVGWCKREWTQPQRRGLPSKVAAGLSIAKNCETPFDWGISQNGNFVKSCL